MSDHRSPAERPGSVEETTVLAGNAPRPPSLLGTDSSASLDQWRGLALVLVLVSHGFFHTNRVHGIGRVGVNLFFFISGVLVYRSLARQEQKPAWDRTRSFWWRRFRRLFPALLAYVVAIAPLVYFGQHLSWLPPRSSFGEYLRAVPVALIYLVNFDWPVKVPLSLGHLWSLACEMQFYLLAPLIYIAGGRSSLRRHLVWGGLLLLLMGLGVTQPLFGEETKYYFQFAVWPMMLGFFCEYKKPWLNQLPRKLSLAAAWGGVALLVASTVLMLDGIGMKKLVIASGALVLIPCFVFYSAGSPIPGLPGRILLWLGERTYSIYLWQQPLTICGFLPAVLRPLGAAFSAVIGGVWFRFFEWPFLSMSRRK
jgi:peptidoglycan/LPS O-acetylase OafA/YrhL